MTCLTLLALTMVSTTLLARGDQPPRLDALGDPLPPQALLRLGTSRLGHADPSTTSPSPPTVNPSPPQGRSTTGFSASGISAMESAASGRNSPPTAIPRG